MVTVVRSWEEVPFSPQLHSSRAIDTTNSVSQVQSLYQSKSLRLSQLSEEVLIRLNKPGTTQREWKQTKRLMFEGRDEKGVKYRCMHFFLPTMRYKRKTK